MTATVSSFPRAQDGSYAWSAAFVSYVMRIAGAGPRFPYSASHSDYIDMQPSRGSGPGLGLGVTAERAETYAAATWRYDLLRSRQRASTCVMTICPPGTFQAHCDIVVDTACARTDQRHRRQCR